MSTNVKILVLVAVAVVGSFTFYALGRPEWAPVAQAAPGCDAGDLDGTYSFVIHGTNPVGQPFGAIGTFTADGVDTLEGFRAAVDNGLYSTAEFTCTYNMSPACMFRGPCVDDGEVIAELQIDGALADGHREIELLVSNLPAAAGGAVVTGVAHKQ